MGPASKRRGNGDTGGSVSRSAKLSSGRIKEKLYKTEKEPGREKSSKHERENDSGSNRHQSSGRGGARNRILARATAAGRSSNSDKSSPADAVGPLTRRRKALDPTLLARGMSARSIGARVSSQIKTLSSDEIERDLRHMEAYGAACIAYSQQFFAYTNRELVSRGVYGPAPPAPGISLSDSYSQNGSAPNGVQGAYAGQFSQLTDQTCVVAGTTPNSVSVAPVGGVTMPVRIDPEEEKRLAILRKRVAASEAKREVLETEYLSLRAHYIHESHQLRRTRNAVTGQLKLLKEMVKQRGEVLALRRVRCAMAKDVLHCLEYRAQMANSGASNVLTSTENKTDNFMDGGKYSDKPKKNHNSDNKEEDKFPTDLVDAWSWVESKLQEAELACINIETPKELLQVKGALNAAASRTNFSSSKNSSSSNLGIRRSRSPTKVKGKDDDESVSNGSTKKKNKTEKDTKNSINDKGPKSSQKRSSNSTAGEDSSTEKDGSVASSSGKRSSSDSGHNTVSKKPSEADFDDNIIPWDCQIMPRTPFDVPILISLLSKVPDGSAAYGCGPSFGSSSSSLRWLEPNLPIFFNPGMEEEREKLRKLREEVKILSRELEREVDHNRDLQNQVIAGRKRSDEMCAMMSMLRTETEAVLNRHNIILETPEARSRANAMAMKEVEDDLDDDEVDEIDEDDVEIDEEGDIEGEGTVVAEDEDGEEIHDDDEVDDDEDQISLSIADDNGGASLVADNAAVETDSAEEGEIQEEDNDGDDEEEDIEFDDDEEEGQQPIKEVIVPRLNSNAKRQENKQLSQQSQNRVVEDEEEEGEINEDEEGEIKEENESQTLPTEAPISEDIDPINEGKKRLFDDDNETVSDIDLDKKRRKL